MSAAQEQQAPPTWQPNDGPQFDFLSSAAYEALYGGAAGGGKTQALVLGALRYVSVPKYNAIIFRRTFPALAGEVIPISLEWYPHLGGVYNAVDHVWKFPSGARIHFGHLQHDNDVHRYQGWQFQYIGFDELTTFTEHQYRYLRSRLRSPGGAVPVALRAGTNPGGEGHEWVFKRWGPWLDPQCPVKARSGQELWAVEQEGHTDWVTNAEAATINAAYQAAGDIAREKMPVARKRVFYPARISDNPSLSKTEYSADLNSLDAVTRAQLRDGDWLIKPAAGLLFKRGWFSFVDAVPAKVAARVRRWDLASTQDGGDWTIGVKMARLFDRTYVVEDVVRVRMKPHGVEQTVRATAELDGHACEVWLPEDPGQAGKAQSAAYAKLMQGFTVKFERETGDKVTRAKPFSAQCEAGNVAIVRAPWNEPFLQCHEAFPDGAHDDDVDAAAGAFNALTRSGVLTYIEAVTKMAAGAKK